MKIKIESAFDREFLDAKDNWKGLCPFHDEKTPSFYIHKEEYIGHCFGCGVSGNLAALVARYKSIPEDRGREILGITAEETVAARRRHEQATRIGEQPPQIYPESWLGPWKREISDYILNRGLSRTSLIASETRYDRSAKRQVFPHRNREGRLLGAAGRSVVEADPKWYFYWGYDKGRTTYRLPSKTRGSDNQSLRPTFVVEGIFDALRLEEYGYDACALLGSKATYYQAQEIKDTSNNVVIALDNDEPGREGCRRLLRQLRNLSVRIIDWPDEANDIMDLQDSFLQHLETHLLTPVQWKTKHLDF